MFLPVGLGIPSSFLKATWPPPSSPSWLNPFCFPVGLLLHCRLCFASVQQADTSLPRRTRTQALPSLLVSDTPCLQNRATSHVCLAVGPVLRQPVCPAMCLGTGREHSLHDGLNHVGDEAQARLHDDCSRHISCPHRSDQLSNRALHTLHKALPARLPTREPRSAAMAAPSAGVGNERRRRWHDARPLESQTRAASDLSIVSHVAHLLRLAYLCTHFPSPARVAQAGSDSTHPPPWGHHVCLSCRNT